MQFHFVALNKVPSPSHSLIVQPHASRHSANESDEITDREVEEGDAHIATITGGPSPTQITGGPSPTQKTLQPLLST